MALTRRPVTCYDAETDTFTEEPYMTWVGVMCVYNHATGDLLGFIKNYAADLDKSRHVAHNVMKGDLIATVTLEIE